MEVGRSRTSNKSPVSSGLPLVGSLAMRVCCTANPPTPPMLTETFVPWGTGWMPVGGGLRVELLIFSVVTREVCLACLVFFFFFFFSGCEGMPNQSVTLL
jgi:hypothetical protein